MVIAGEVVSDDAAAAPNLGSARLDLDRGGVVSDWTTSRVLSLLTAVMLHAAVFATMLRSTADELGAGGHQLEAIGVELVTAEALMSLQMGGEHLSAPASAASEQAGEDAKTESDPKDTRPTEKEAPPPDPTPMPEDAPAEMTEPAPSPRDQPHEKPDLPKAKAPDQAPTGGSVAEGRDTRSVDVVPARSAAQAGAINRFVSDLRSRLARTKPRGLRMSGVAIVTFTLLRSGEIESAYVSKSSGKPQLDEAALNAVRRTAPFARPPTWMQKSELVFSIPYHFE